MSLPTTDAIFAQSRAADSWVEYPFMERGDSTAKIYHMKCSVNRDDYAPLVINVAMGSAGAAGVISLPFAANASAFFVGDFNHSYKNGGLVEFDRQFATIPATRTRELVGSRSFGFPGVKGYAFVPPVKDTDEQILFEVAEGSGNNSPAPLYLTSTYYKSASIPTSLPVVFRATENGNAVDYVSDGRTMIATLYVQDTQSSDPNARVSETFNETKPATIPTYTTYDGYVSNETKITVDVEVERYAGDIFVVKEYEMVAQ